MIRKPYISLFLIATLASFLGIFSFFNPLQRSFFLVPEAEYQYFPKLNFGLTKNVRNFLPVSLMGDPLRSLPKEEIGKGPLAVAKPSSAPAPAPLPPPSAPSMSVGSEGAFEVRDSQNQLITSFFAEKIKISYWQGEYLVFGPNGFIASSKSYFRVIPLGAAILELPDYVDLNWNKRVNLNRFRGNIEVRYSSTSQALWAINELPLEDYLKGITEASADAPEEHLKVMAIVARSYAYYHVKNGGRHKGEPFHLKNSRNGNGDDQVYQGYLAEVRLPRIAAAASVTGGEVVTFQGEPVITPYSMQASGRTRTPREAGWNYDWPWVQSVSDPDTAGMPRIGHGVGLSGYGSRKRAERGDSHQTILSYYFPGTSVGKIDTSNVIIRVAIYFVKS